MDVQAPGRSHAAHRTLHAGGIATAGDVLWAKRWKMPLLNGLTLEGYSRAGDITCFCVKEWQLYLEAGEYVHSSSSSYIMPTAVLLTHAHTDHAFSLPLILINTHGVKVYAPRESVELLHNFIVAAYQMSECGASPREDWYSLVGLADQEVVTVDVGKHHNHVRVRALRMDHAAPCLSYLISEIRHRLMPQYAGAEWRELKQLREEKGEIMEEYDYPLFAFLSDTSIAGLLRVEAEVTKYPVVIVECTYLHHDHRGTGADAQMHIAWPDLEPLVRKLILAQHSGTTWVLTHFSLRYTPAELEHFFASKALPNVHPWICGGSDAG